MSGGRLNLVSSNVGFGNTAITGNAVTMLITSNTMTWSRDNNQELDAKFTGVLTSNTLVVANLLSIPGVLQANATAQTLSIQTIVSANGSGLTGLNASQISSGTLSNARLPANINVTSITANGAGLYDLTAWNISSGTLSNDRLPSTISVAEIAANGAGLYGLNASAISTGTLQNARLPSTIVVSEISAFGSGLSGLNASNIISGTLSNQRLPSSIAVSNISANGAGLSQLSASNVSTGTLSNARLPSSISVSEVSANFSGNGAGLSQLSASNVSTGTLSNARLPSSISVEEVSANITGNGSGVSQLNASNIMTGTLQNARLPATISVSNVVANLFGNGYGITDLDADSLRFGTVSNALLPANITVNNIAANLSGNGVGVYSLNASNISSGVLQNARLPSDIVVSNVSANLSGNGVGVYSLNASNISSGVLQNARLPSDITVANVSANLSGNGVGVYSLNASNISSGVLSNARLPSDITVANVSANLSGDGVGVYSLNASNISSGVLQNARLPSDITVANVTANVSGNGSGIFAINASNVTIGTLSNARLPNTVSVGNVVANLFGNGYGITDLDADSLVYGTVSNSLLPYDISVANVTANLSGNGAGISQLNASNVSTGILAVERGGTGVSTKTGTGNVVLSDNSVLRNLTTMDTAHILGNLRVSGNVLVDTGNVVYVNAQTILTDQMVITNEGTGPALVVRQNDDQPVFEAKDDANVVFKVYDGGFIGIAPGNSTALATNTPPSANTVTILGTLSAQLSANDLVTGTLSNARLPASINVTSISADGSALTNLNASNISSGTLQNSRLPASISVSSVTANLVGDATAVSNVNAGNLSYGVLQNARLPLAISVTSISADGSALTNLNASNISSGTLQNARLPSAISVASVTANLSGNASGISNINIANTYGTLSNARLPDDIVVGNVTATSYLFGNGIYLTGISGGGGSGNGTTNASDINSGILAVQYGGTGTITKTGTGSVVLNTSPIFSGTVTANGNVAADYFIGNGSFLTGVASSNASSLTEGTISNALLPSSISVSNVSANGAALTSLNLANTYGTLSTTKLPSDITVSGNVSGQYLLGNGALLTGIVTTGFSNASNITSGILSVPYGGTGTTTSTGTGNVVLSNDPTFQGNVSINGYLYGNGAYLTGISSSGSTSNASLLTEGTLDNARLPSSISVTSISANGFGLSEINAANIVGNIDANVNLVGTLNVENGGTGVTTSSGSGNVVLSDTPTFQGLVTVNGNVTANYIHANGAGLYGILASNVVGLQAQLQNLTANSVTANYVAGNGSGLFGIPLANTTGLLEENRLPANISGNGAGLYGLLASNIVGLQAQLQDLTANSVTANVLKGNLEASYLTGTIENARLPASMSISNISANGSALTSLNLANTYGILPSDALSGEYANVQSLRVYGNVRVGNLLIDSGNITSFTTNVQISEQLVVTNEGTGPGIRVRQNYTQPIFEAMDDANVTFKIYDGGFVGIGSGTANLGASPPTSALLSVVGNVSATSYQGNLDASYLTGTLDNARLPSNITVNHVTADNFTGNVEVANLEYIIESGGTFEAAPGNVVVPGYAFDMDTSTGMYRPLANTVGFVCGGVQSARFSQTGLVVNANVTANYIIGSGQLLTGIVTTVNVKDFGAVSDCTGVGIGTDVIQPIKAAVDYAIANVGNGAKIILPPGRYRASTTAFLNLNRLSHIEIEFQGIITPDNTAMTVLTIENAESLRLKASIYQGGVFSNWNATQPYGPCDYSITRDAAAAGGQEMFLIRGVLDYTIDLEANEYAGRLLRTDERSNTNHPYTMAIKGCISTRRSVNLSNPRVAQSLWADGGTANPNIGNWGGLERLVCDFDMWGPVWSRLNDIHIGTMDCAFAYAGPTFLGCIMVTGTTWYIGDIDTQNGGRHVQFLPQNGINCAYVSVKYLMFLKQGEGLYMDGVSNAIISVTSIGPNFGDVLTLINCLDIRARVSASGTGSRLCRITGSSTNNLQIEAYSQAVHSEDIIDIESNVTGIVTLQPFISNTTESKSIIKVAGATQVNVMNPTMTSISTGYIFDIANAQNSVSVFSGTVISNGGAIYKNSIRPCVIIATVGLDPAAPIPFRSNSGGNSAGSGGEYRFGIAAAGLQHFSPMAQIKGLLDNATGSELQGKLALQIRPLGTAGQSLIDAITASAATANGEMTAVILALINGSYVTKRVKVGEVNTGPGGSGRVLYVDN